MPIQIWIDDQIADRSAFAGLGDLFTFSGRTVSKDALKHADALIVRSVTRVDESLLEGTPVQFVGTVTTGVDHLDIDYLRDRGIALATAAGFNARPVAEYVLAAIFLLADQRKLRPREMTLGIVGAGRIGTMIGRWASIIGMQVLYNDPPLEAEGDPGPWTPIDVVLAQSDIVSLHVPYNATGPYSTAGMADADWLSKMKPAGSLINTSRGGIVDENALLTALNRQDQFNAIIDTWMNEPDVDHELVDRSRIATPHIAGHTLEAKRRGSGIIRDALSAWLSKNCAQQMHTAAPQYTSNREGPSSVRSGIVESEIHSISDNEVTKIADAASRTCCLEQIDREFRAALREASHGFDAARVRSGSRTEFSHVIDFIRM